MKRGDTDNGGGSSDGRIEALVDEALREALDALAVTVKARVMAAWDERERATGLRLPRAELRGLPRVPSAVWRPAVALASVLVIAAAALLLWQRTSLPTGDRRTASREATGTPAERQGAGGPGDTTQAQVETGPGLEQALRTEPGAAAVRSGARRARRPTVVVEFPVEQLAASNGTHLPGAPAGDLGDPIGAMPGPPALTVQPVVTAPMLSETTRPVTDFPAEDQPPGQAPSQSGQAEGERR